MRRTSLVALLICLPALLVAQQACDTLYFRKVKLNPPRTDTLVVKWRDAIVGQLERTAFYPVNGIVDNLPALLFEGSITSHFIFREVPTSIRNRWLKPLAGISTVAGYRADVRMRTAGTSMPVRTPSYQPSVTFFRAAGIPGFRCSLAFAQVRHFSNGQEGASAIGDSVNYDYGSFSTNFVKAGFALTVVAPDGATYYRPAIEYHFGRDSLVTANYGAARLHLQKLDLITQARGSRLTNATIRQVDLYYHFRGGRALDNIAVSAAKSWRPPVFEDFGLVASAYWGPDYYNIWFMKRLWTLRIGLLADGSAFVFK